MSSSQIRAQIYSNENRIDELYGQIRKLRDDIDQLCVLESEFRDLKSSYESRQSKRKKGLSGFLNLNLGSSIVSAYYDGMSSLLSGREYASVMDGLDTGRSKAYDKRRDLEDQVDQCEREIHRLESDNQYLHARLCEALEAEREASGT